MSNEYFGITRFHKKIKDGKPFFIFALSKKNYFLSSIAAFIFFKTLAVTLL